MKLITNMFGLVTAILSAVLIIIRLVESINQLSEKPKLNTFQKCIQVVKNFFIVEKYK